MTSDQLRDTLICIDKKLDTVRLDVKGLSTKMESIETDVKTLSGFPIKVQEIDTRVDHNEDEIKSIRSKTWAVIVIVITTLLTAVAGITVNVFTG